MVKQIYSIHTVATANTRGLQALLKSNSTITIHGLGTDWSALKKYCWKWRAEQFIAIANKADTKWLVILDAYDTLLSRDFDIKINSILNNLKKEFLISGEKINEWCGPNCLELKMYKGWFANPGAFIATPAAIKKVFGAFLLSSFYDDQYFINYYMNENNCIQLDMGEFCQTIVRDTIKDAAMYHFPGPWTDIGWSRLYNEMVGTLASGEFIPKQSLIPHTLINKIIKPEYYSLILFIFQVCTFWLGTSVLFLNKIDSRILISLAFAVYIILHTHQTYT